MARPEAVSIDDSLCGLAGAFPSRCGAAFAVDHARSWMYVFGGERSRDPYVSERLCNDLWVGVASGSADCGGSSGSGYGRWVWHRVRVTERTVKMPCRRRHAALAVGDNGKLFLHGGETADGTILGDLCYCEPVLKDGRFAATWHRLALPAGAPDGGSAVPALSRHVLAVRRSELLFMLGCTRAPGQRGKKGGRPAPLVPYYDVVSFDPALRCVRLIRPACIALTEEEGLPAKKQIRDGVERGRMFLCSRRVPTLVDASAAPCGDGVLVFGGRGCILDASSLDDVPYNKDIFYLSLAAPDDDASAGDAGILEASGGGCVRSGGGGGVDPVAEDAWFAVRQTFDQIDPPTARTCTLEPAATPWGCLDGSTNRCEGATAGGGTHHEITAVRLAAIAPTWLGTVHGRSGGPGEPTILVRFSHLTEYLYGTCSAAKAGDGGGGTGSERLLREVPDLKSARQTYVCCCAIDEAAVHAKKAVAWTLHTPQDPLPSSGAQKQRTGAGACASSGRQHARRKRNPFDDEPVPPPREGHSVFSLGRTLIACGGRLCTWETPREGATAASAVSGDVWSTELLGDGRWEVDEQHVVVAANVSPALRAAGLRLPGRNPLAGPPTARAGPVGVQQTAEQTAAPEASSGGSKPAEETSRPSSVPPEEMAAYTRHTPRPPVPPSRLGASSPAAASLAATTPPPGGRGAMCGTGKASGVFGGGHEYLCGPNQYLHLFQSLGDTSLFVDWADKVSLGNCKVLWTPPHEQPRPASSGPCSASPASRPTSASTPGAAPQKKARPSTARGRPTSNDEANCWNQTAPVKSNIIVMLQPGAPATIRERLRSGLGGSGGAEDASPPPGDGADRNVLSLTEGKHPLDCKLTLRNVGSSGSVVSVVHLSTDVDHFVTDVIFSDSSTHVKVCVRIHATLSGLAKRQHFERQQHYQDAERQRAAALLQLLQREQRRDATLAEWAERERRREDERLEEAAAVERLRERDRARQRRADELEVLREQLEAQGKLAVEKEERMEGMRKKEVEAMKLREKDREALVREQEVRLKKISNAEEELASRRSQLERERGNMQRERQQYQREKQWEKTKEEENDKERTRLARRIELLQTKVDQAAASQTEWEVEKRQLKADLEEVSQRAREAQLKLDLIDGRFASETDVDWAKRKEQRDREEVWARSGDFVSGSLHLHMATAAPEQVTYYMLGSTVPRPVSAVTRLSVTTGERPPETAPLKQALLVVAVLPDTYAGDVLSLHGAHIDPHTSDITHEALHLGTVLSDVDGAAGDDGCGIGSAVADRPEARSPSAEGSDDGDFKRSTLRVGLSGCLVADAVECAERVLKLLSFHVAHAEPSSAGLRRVCVSLTLNSHTLRATRFLEVVAPVVSVPPKDRQLVYVEGKGTVSILPSVSFTGLDRMAAKARDEAALCVMCSKRTSKQTSDTKFLPMPSHRILPGGGFLSVRSVQGWSSEDYFLLGPGLVFNEQTLGISTEDGVVIGTLKYGQLAQGSAPMVQYPWLTKQAVNDQNNQCVGVQFAEDATWALCERLARGISFRNDSSAPSRPRRLLEFIYVCGTRDSKAPPAITSAVDVPTKPAAREGKDKKAKQAKAHQDMLVPALQLHHTLEVNVINVDEPTEIHVVSDALEYSYPHQFLTEDLLPHVAFIKPLPVCKGSKVVDEDTDVVEEGHLKISLDHLAEDDHIGLDATLTSSITIEELPEAGGRASVAADDQNDTLHRLQRAKTMMRLKSRVGLEGTWNGVGSGGLGTFKGRQYCVRHDGVQVACMTRDEYEISILFTGYHASITAVEELLQTLVFWCDPAVACVSGIRCIVIELVIGAMDVLCKRLTVDAKAPHIILPVSVQSVSFKEGSPPVSVTVPQSQRDCFPTSLIKFSIVDGREDGDTLQIKGVSEVGSEAIPWPRGFQEVPVNITSTLMIAEEIFLIKTQESWALHLFVASPLPSEQVKAVLRKVTYVHTSKNPLSLSKVCAIVVTDVTVPNITTTSATAVSIRIVPTDDATEFKCITDVESIIGSLGDQRGTRLVPDVVVYDPDTDSFEDGYLLVEAPDQDVVLDILPVSAQIQIYEGLRQEQVEHEKNLVHREEDGTVWVHDDRTAYQTWQESRNCTGSVMMGWSGGDGIRKVRADSGVPPPFALTLSSNTDVTRERLQFLLRNLMVRTPSLPSKYTFSMRCNAGNVPVSNEAVAQFNVVFLAPNLSPTTGFNVFDYKADARQLLFGGVSPTAGWNFKEVVQKAGSLTLEVMGRASQGVRDKVGLQTKDVVPTSPFTIVDGVLSQGKTYIGQVTVQEDPQTLFMIHFDPDRSKVDNTSFVTILKNIVFTRESTAGATSAFDGFKTVQLRVVKDPTLSRNLNMVLGYTAVLTANDPALPFTVKTVPEHVAGTGGLSMLQSFSFTQDVPFLGMGFEVHALGVPHTHPTECVSIDEVFELPASALLSQMHTGFRVDFGKDTAKSMVLATIRAARFYSIYPGKRSLQITLTYKGSKDEPVVQKRIIWITVHPPMLSVTRCLGRLAPCKAAGKGLDVFANVTVEAPPRKKAFRGGMIVIELSTPDEVTLLRKCRGKAREEPLSPVQDSIQFTKSVTFNKDDSVTVGGVIIGKAMTRLPAKVIIMLEARKESATPAAVQTLVRSIQFLSSRQGSEGAMRLSIQDGKDGPMNGCVVCIAATGKRDIQATPLSLLPSAC